LAVPLLAVPGLTRPALNAAVPGFMEPRIEALLRALPKDARRNLIPIADTAAKFLASLRADAGAGAGAAAADAQSLAVWLKEQRGIAEPLLRFDLSTVPPHLTPHLAVIADGKVLARGQALGDLRRRCAGAARAELDRRAQAAHRQSPAWRRFELDELPDSVDLALEHGTITVYPTLGGAGRPLAVHYEWSAAEARRSWQRGAVDLARILLERQARTLELEIAADGALMLAATPYSPRGPDSPPVIDALLHLTFRRACFGDSDAPRTRDAYQHAVDQGRARLHGCQEEIRAEAASWFALAREVRRAQGEPRNAQSAEAADETREHLLQLLRPDALRGMPADRLRQLPRYLKAEERRWQRGAARGGESAHILREIRHWSSRLRELEAKCDAELRFIPELEDFRGWIEEYRVSLYAQELKTPGPISAARLEQRAAEIVAWLAR
jgi:ATP-dependent helicase HrpA